MSSQPVRTLEAAHRPEVSNGAQCMIAMRDIELRVPASIFTLEGFRAWATSDESPERARITFLDGQVSIDMGGEEIQTHGLVKTETCAVMGQLNTEMNRGLFFISSCLITNVLARVSNIPDAVLVTWASLESGRVRAVPRKRRRDQYVELEGTPDLVLEIISESSVGKDMQRLRAAYHRAGIPEYWLIDARGEEIDFQLLVHRPADYQFALQRGGWQRSRVFNRRFRLTRQRGPFEFWQYRLEVKPLR